MKLNLGCGRAPKEGWINADWTQKEKTLNDFPEIEFMDATNPWQYADDTFDYIFTEHMIEHIEASKNLFTLQEAYRTMKPGGVIRVIIPDRDFFEQLPGQDDHPFVVNYCRNIFKREPYAGASDAVTRRTLDEQGHVWVVGIEKLKAQVTKAGFSEVKQCEYGVSEHAELNGIDLNEGIFKGLREYESIVVEGTKHVRGAI